MNEQKKKRRKSRLVERSEYALFRIVSFPVRHASEAATNRWSDRFARWAPRLLKSRHELALKNLARVFPDKSLAEREAIARACWRHFATMSLRFIRQSGAQMPAARITVPRRQMVVDAVARGRGVIVVTAHYGDWEGAITALTGFDVPITIVARALDNALLEGDLYRARIRSNVTMVDRRKAARTLVRTLDAGGMVVVLADQAVKPREGIKVPFLGLPAWTTPAPARLALRTGSPIFTVFCEPSDDSVLIHVDDAIEPAGQTPEALMTRVNEAISARIREKPELWLWMHDRWKKA